MTYKHSDDSSPQVRIWLLTILTLVILSGAVFYFSSKDVDFQNAPNFSATPRQSRNPRTYTVSYSNGVFSPTNLRIHLGDTVHFQNKNSISIRIVSERINGVPQLSTFDSISAIPSQEFFSYTFIELGIWGYQNALNNQEHGSIIVR